MDRHGPGVLEKEFAEPPASARPELFWDWMQDLVTKEGITHDLEARQNSRPCNA